MDAAKANDCEAIEDLVTERLLEDEGGCEVEDMPADFTYVVSEATVDEDAGTASVPVDLTVAEVGDESDPITLAMVVDDDEWKVDDIDRPRG